MSDFLDLTPLDLEIVDNDFIDQEIIHRIMHNDLGPRADALLTAGQRLQMRNPRFGTSFINVCDAPYNANPLNNANIDSGAAILTAIAASQPQGGGFAKGVYIPAGVYHLLTPVDMGTILRSGGGLVQGWTLWCDENAIFINHNASAPGFSFRFPVGASNPFVDYFIHCRIKLGRVYGQSSHVNPFGTACNVYFRWVNASVIDITYSGNARNPVLFDESDDSEDCIFGSFVNQIYVRQIEGMFGGVGFLVKGNTDVSAGWGFQSNEVHLAWVEGIDGNAASPYRTSTGVQIGTEVGDTSWGNRFDIGVAQDLITGVMDYRGNNEINFLSTANNSKDFVLPANATQQGVGAFGTGSVRGVMVAPTGSINLNNQKYDVVNSATVPGAITAPAFPLSGQSFYNPKDRPARISIPNEGAITAINIDGQGTALTYGMFRLLPGERISISYGGTPRWLWWLE